MKKLFVEKIYGDKITLNEEQSRHVAKSLRMRKGDMLTLCDGGGDDYGCIIDEITKNSVTLSVCYKQASQTEPGIKVSLFQGVPKSGKLEDIIQKCVELGIYEITPVLTKRSVSRPDKKQAAAKRARYRKIALEAAQQSGRGIVPEINEMTDLKSALSATNADLVIIFYEGGGKSLKSLISSEIKSIAIFIGPEGGFEKEEVEAVINAGGSCASLGPRILRTQTAPVAALSAIMTLTGNLE